MTPEDRAARIVHRLLMSHVSYEWLHQVLVNQDCPWLNQAVAFVADEIREAIEAAMTHRRDSLPPGLEAVLEELWQDPGEGRLGEGQADETYEPLPVWRAVTVNFTHVAKVTVVLWAWARIQVRGPGVSAAR